MLEGYQEIHVRKSQSGQLIVEIMGVKNQKVFHHATKIASKDDLRSFAAEVTKRVNGS